MAKFNHPHIVTIYEVGEHQGSPYVAPEYLEGQSLRQRLREERPGLREMMRIGLAIAEALREAHRHKILHRDLKPENIFIPKDGRIRVLDFGLAKALAAPIEFVEASNETAPVQSSSENGTFQTRAGARYRSSGERTGH